MIENSFISLINQPTRITDSNGTLLDHIWTNTPINQNILSGILTYNISDDLPVYLCLKNIPLASDKLVQKRNFSYSNIQSFNNDLQSLDILPILNETDPSLGYHLLLQSYTHKFNTHFPLKSFSTKHKNAPWFDSDLRNLLSKKQSAFKKYLRNKSSQNKDNFKKKKSVLSNNQN